MTMTQKTLLLSLVLYFSAATAVVAESPRWSQFRGIDGDGRIAADVDLSQVGKADYLVWRTEVGGVGWSSPVTDGQHLWLTSSVATKATQAQRERALAGKQFAKMKDVAGAVDLFAFCVDAETGQVKWKKLLGKIDRPNPIHPMNSYASPTPVLADDRVVFHFGGYGTWCVNKDDGETLWRQQLVVDDSVGPGSSPVRLGDRVIVACDGIDQQFVAAMSLADGSVLWQTPRPPMRAANPEFQKAYSTPLVTEVNGQMQAIVPGAQWIAAYDPSDGSEIWRVDGGDGFSNATMPLRVGDTIIYSTGFTSPEFVAIDPTGQGDVTGTHVVWRQGRNAPMKPSMSTDGKLIYSISDSGVLVAISCQDGDVVWRKRIGGTFSASPVITQDAGFIAGHDGTLVSFALGDQFEQIGQIDFDEQVMASPIAVGNDIVLRTKDALYRYRSGP